MPKTRAQLLALLAPRQAPTPKPLNERARTSALLHILAGLVVGIGEKAHALYLAARATTQKRDPGLPFTRVMRATRRIMALMLRLRQAKPLPARTPIRPKPARPIHPPAPATAPPAFVKPKPGRRRRRSDDLARTDIQRLLRTKSLPEILALICRDLGLSPDPATWPTPSHSRRPPPPAIHPTPRPHNPAPSRTPIPRARPPHQSPVASWGGLKPAANTP